MYAISKHFFTISSDSWLMTLVVVTIITLNHCEVIWNKITVAAAILLSGKKGNRVGLLGG